jgi:hypothetical protein
LAVFFTLTSSEALNIIKEALHLKQRNRDSTKRGAFCAKQLLGVLWGRKLINGVSDGGNDGTRI